MSPLIENTAVPPPIVEATPPSSKPRDAANSFSNHLQQASQGKAEKSSHSPARTDDSTNQAAAKQDAVSGPDANTNGKTAKAKSEPERTAANASAKSPEETGGKPTDADQPPAREDAVAQILLASQVFVSAPQVQLPQAVVSRPEIAAALEAAPEAHVDAPAPAHSVGAVVAASRIVAETKAARPAAMAHHVNLASPRPMERVTESTARAEQPAGPTKSVAALETPTKVGDPIVTAARPAAEKKEHASRADAKSATVAKPVGELPTATAATLPLAATLSPVSPATAENSSQASERRTSQPPSDLTDRRAEPLSGPNPSSASGVGQPPHGRPILDTQPRGLSRADDHHRLTEAERARFVQRVAHAVQSASENGGPIRLRLSPPELGSMRLEIHVADGQMSARIETETPQARTALLDNLPMLREQLDQQNIKIARFDVDLFDGAGGNLSHSPQRDLNHDSPLPRHQLRRDAAGPVGAPRTDAPRAGVSADGRLNVVI